MSSNGDADCERPSWNRFWFSPASELPLDRMRIAVGVLVAFWLLTFFGRQADFFGFSSWLSRDVYASVKKLPYELAVPDSPGSRLPTPNWSPMYFAASPAVVHALYFVSLAAAVALAAGIMPIVTAPLTWLGVCSFTSNPVFNGAGTDSMLLVLGFYLMVGFVLRRALPLGVGDNFALRMMQVHVATLILSAGLGKLQQSVWWEGLALWFAKNPPYDLTIERANQLRETGGISFDLRWMSAAAYLTLVWQLTFPVFAFRRWARRWIVGGTFVGLFGCWHFYGLPMFGPSWFVASLAFLTADEWKSLGERFGRRQRAESAV